MEKGFVKIPKLQVLPRNDHGYMRCISKYNVDVLYFKVQCRCVVFQSTMSMYCILKYNVDVCMKEKSSLSLSLSLSYSYSFSLTLFLTLSLSLSLCTVIALEKAATVFGANKPAQISNKPKSERENCHPLQSNPQKLELIV